MNGQPKEVLKPFSKGDKRINRKGRPAVLPGLKEAIAKVLAEEKDGVNALEAILKTMRAKAVKGDVRAAQELLDRAFGKPKQSIEHSGNVFENVIINITKKGND